MSENKSKAFNDYYRRAWLDIGDLQPWQYPRLKRIAYNAWLAGRKHERKLKPNPPEVE